MHSDEILYLPGGRVPGVVEAAHVGGRGAELDLVQARAAGTGSERAHAGGGRGLAALAGQRTAARRHVREHGVLVQRARRTLGHKNFRSRALKP